MKKRILALIMAVVLVVSLAACGEKPTTSTPEPTPSTAPAPTKEPTKAPVQLPTDGSLTFEDGNLSFAKVYMKHATSDASTLEIADYNGSKALKITKAAEGKKPFVAFDVNSLLGENAAKVAKVAMTIGTEYADGSFSATEGSIYFWTDKNVSSMAKESWSVYVKNKNPKVVEYNMPEGVTFGADVPAFMFQMNTDLGADNGHGSATIYLDNISFFDASGNLIKPASTEVAFVNPVGFEDTEEDRSNLVTLADAVEFKGFQTSGGKWSQTGFDIPQEVLDALVPGSVVEFTFSTKDGGDTDGDIWLVLPNAAAGWSRIAQNEAYINFSHNIAQISYEQIVAVVGEDKSTWGAQLQAESGSEWEVYSLKVGTPGAGKEFVKTVDFAGFETSAGGWAQSGFEMPEEVLNALVPGSGVEISFATKEGGNTDNDIWIVFPGAAAGWSRIAQNKAKIDNGKAYITYEQIVEVVGEDKAAWGTKMECESGSEWEVYSVAIGSLVDAVAKEYEKSVDFAGFETSAGAWAQSGFEMPQEVLDALQPGSVIEINFATKEGGNTDNDIWIVFPGAAAGWSRIAQNKAKIDNGKAYITYEQIVEVVGEDKAAWGTKMECESGTDWEVYSVSVGKMVEAVAKEYEKSVDFAGFETSAGAWAQSGFEMPQEILDALQPGAVIEIAFATKEGGNTDNDLWIVFPGAAAGWSRIAQNKAKIVDGKAYITYEQIVEVVGEDKAAWGTKMECESGTDWEVYSVSVGKFVDAPTAPRLHKLVKFDGFATTGNAWAQSGFTMPENILNALVPGSVVVVEFATEEGGNTDNDLWLVFPGAAAGWSRIAQNQAVIAKGRAYITYDQIISVVGEDKSGWGTDMQCESGTNWEVFAVYVGQ
ncbi:MAG: hypothetical protein J6U10_06005 [Lachnospiraceae bacterium]|nr:hypothetical protein [Lachnospiraceae bacterium]